MSAHWKYGNRFAIRYGGFKDIRWYFSDQSQAHPVTFGGAAGAHPVVVAVLEVAKVAAMYLQWWEQRRQNNLAEAQFEERRIPWLLEIMNRWHSEAEAKQICFETLKAFDRELTRLFDKILSNEKIDLPSEMLLQITQATQSIAGLNQVLHGLFMEASLRQEKAGLIKDIQSKQSFKYLNFKYFHGSPGKIQQHLNHLEREMKDLEDAERFANETAFKKNIARIEGFAHIFIHPSSFIALTLWKSWRNLKKQGRSFDFIQILELLVELRSAQIILLNLSRLAPEQLLIEEAGTQKIVDDDQYFSFTPAESTKTKKSA